MKLYVLSTKYLPLVDVNFDFDDDKLSASGKLVTKKNITIHDVTATFNASKTDSLLAFEKKQHALVIMTWLLKGHNTMPDFIEDGVRLFAAPVIYTVELDDAALPQATTLTSDALANYADLSTIPLYKNKKSASAITDANEKLACLLSQAPETINVRNLVGLKLEDVLEASYPKADESDLVNIALKSTGLFAQLNNYFSSKVTKDSSPPVLSAAPKNN